MNLFELFGVIAINNKAANKSLDETTGKAKGITAVFDKVGKAVTKSMAVITAAGAAATGALLKASISAYGEFEQLEGGVKKLFGKDMETVMANANRAYKTAGLSANQYMEQVTSFSASLIKSLGDDTAAAAKMSDMAIQDMADNANTFGTNISSIQDAYQGFAKQNYTMLDNLKLGYGGTAEEMARLVNDSGVMGKNFKATAKNINDVSFAKIIEAIHVVQSEMGIAGTTAAEASDTIQGSFTAWKATWTNLMTGLGDEENVEPLVDAFFDAGRDVLRNLGKVLPKIGRNLVDAMQQAGARVRMAWATKIWPSIQEFTKATFGIEMPEWSAIESQVSTWWAGIRTGFEGFCTWVLQPFNTPEWETVKATADSWWNGDAGIYELLKSVFKWTLGGFDKPDEQSSKGFLADIKAWWDEQMSSSKTNVFQWTFGELLLPAWADLAEGVTNWWNTDINPFIETIANIATGKMEWPTLSEVMASARQWWPSVKESLQRMFIFVITGKVAPVYDLSEVNADMGEIGVDTTSGATTIGVANTEAGEYVNQFGHIVKKTDGSNANGLDRVPFDGYISELHKGEAVLTAREAEIWRSGGYGADTSRLESIMNQVLTVMHTIANNTGAGQGVYLDGTILAGQIAPRLDAQFGTMTARKGRR